MAKKRKSKITFGKSVIMACKKIKRTILSFYKASEFNRGLSVGLVILVVFTVGYTVASAALPTANDFPAINSPDYEVLFPNNYIKPQFNTYFHYFIDGDNENTDEVTYAENGGLTMFENAYNDLLLYDGDANPTLNFTFFTNKINNDYTPRKTLSACKNEYKDGDNDYCGAYLKVNHTFYKHIITYPGQRGIDGTSVANHMYFYNDDDNEEITMTVVSKPSYKFIRDNIDPLPMTFFDKFNFKKLFGIEKSLATNIPMPPTLGTPTIPVVDNTKIQTIGSPQGRSYILKGTIEAFITAEILDKNVFKPMSYLVRSDKPSYVFDGLTAEPNTVISTYTPEDYSDGIDFAEKFNNAAIGDVLNFYKIIGSKLKFVDRWSCGPSGPCSWSDSTVTTKWAARHLGPTKVKISFYNNSVSNYVTFEKEFLDYVAIDSGDTGDYHHLFVYHGDRLSTSNKKDTVTLYMGDPPGGVQSEITNNQAADITYYDDEGILNIFIPKAKANSLQDQPVAEIESVLREYEGEIHSDISSLIQAGILPSEMFEPSQNFKNTNKSYLYWENDIYPYTTGFTPTINTTAQQELIDVWNIKATPVSSLLDYKWIVNAMPQLLTVPGFNGGNGNIFVSPYTTSLRHPITKFKFLPTTEFSNTNNDNKFIPEGDRVSSYGGVYNEHSANNTNGNLIGISMCYVKLSDTDTCLSSDGGTAMMSDYSVDLPIVDIETDSWDGGVNSLHVNDYLGLYYKLYLYDNTEDPPIKDDFVVPVRVVRPASAIGWFGGDQT